MLEKVKNPRIVQGIVVSDKMDKSLIVLVERKIPHPKYGKYVSKTSKFCAHDEANQAKMGDTVRIKESRPRSKKKTWELVEVVSSVA